MSFEFGVVTCKLGALYFYSNSVQVKNFVHQTPNELKVRKLAVNLSKITYKRKTIIKM